MTERERERERNRETPRIIKRCYIKDEKGKIKKEILNKV
jgi:hypothetical protein